MAKEKIGGQKAARRKQRKKKGGITARRKKEFTYRGFSMEELLEMPFDEMVTLLPSRARRTLARGMNDEQRTAFEVLKSGNREITRTHRRDVPIIPQFVGKRVAVHNGKEFFEFEIKPEEERLLPPKRGAEEAVWVPLAAGTEGRHRPDHAGR